MRNLKELFQLMIDESDHIYYNGLCMFINRLCNYQYITDEECMLLRDYINCHRPKWYEFRFYRAFKGITISYYWKPADKKIRIKWLKAQIRKVS